MAVTQISRIQVRRGKKFASAGLPQLSSGEFAWAIDSQELFIGNGSVSEGAPYVGNTKVLTEHDNLLSLVSSQRFAFDNPAISLSVPRSIQDKLDETVSVADFFIDPNIGDGVTDASASFNIAFEQLFLNAVTTFRKTLKIPNGIYVFDTDIEIPSHAIIEGETVDGVIFKLGSSDIRLVEGNESIPQNIKISNLTIEKNGSGFIDITGTNSVDFENVRLTGEYELADPDISWLSDQDPAISWDNDTANATNINFQNCFFDSLKLAIKCTQTTTDTTSAKFQKCHFQNIDVAIYINGEEGQITDWKISECEFVNVANYAVFSTNGRGTIISDCTLTNCGNDLQGSPSTTPIYFLEPVNNVVLNCRSDRIQASGITELEGAMIVPDVINANRANFVNRNYSIITEFSSFRPLIVFSLDNRFIKINYTLNLSTGTRSGDLTITISDDLSQASFSDQYTYTSTTGADMTNFEFNVNIRDNNSDSTNDTLIVSYRNPTSIEVPTSGGSITFDVTYGV